MKLLIAPAEKRAQDAGWAVAVTRQRIPVSATHQAATLRSRPGHLWRRSATLLREGGPGALLASAAAVLGLRRVTVAQLLEDEALARGGPVAEVTIGVLLDPQIPAYLALRPETSETEVKRRLEYGAECVAAWRNGRLVGVRWLRADRAEIAYLGVAISLHPDVWYTFDAFTRPEERRQGISGMITAEVVRRARNRGATAVINFFVPENREGRGLAQRRSRPIGTLRSLRLGPWRVLACRLPAGYLGPVPLSSGA